MVKSKLHHYQNWIFDWSGTLVDDLAMVLDATNHVLAKYGKGEIGREDFRMSFRLPYAGYYEEILPGIPLAELEDHFREGFAHSEASGVTSPLLPYALEFLECLHSKDKRMFILSSMDAAAFERHAVELGIDHFFEATYAGLPTRGGVDSEIEGDRTAVPSGDSGSGRPPKRIRDKRQRWRQRRRLRGRA